MQSAFKLVALIGWFVAGPITFLISAINVWQGSASMVVKVLLWIVVCPIQAAIWPGTWAVWLVSYFAGWSSPIRSVLGL